MSLLAHGTELGARYRIASLIGGSAARAVYEAEDGELGHNCAVEVLTPAALVPERRDELAQRIAIVKKLDAAFLHVPFDAGTDETHDVFFLASPLLHGADLASISRQSGPVPPEQVATWVRQAAFALAPAHAAGEAHRQLSTSSLFLTRDDDGVPRVVLLDFEKSNLLRRETAAVFSAPELLAASTSGEGGPRSDVYAIGHISYALLVSRAYFADASTAEALLEAVSAGAGVPPSERAGAAKVKLPRAFDRWFNMATAVDPDSRFDDVIAAADALAIALGVRAADEGTLRQVIAYDEQPSLGETVPSDDDAKLRAAVAEATASSKPVLPSVSTTLIDPLGDTHASQGLARAAESAIAEVERLKAQAAAREDEAPDDQPRAERKRELEGALASPAERNGQRARVAIVFAVVVLLAVVAIAMTRL